VVPNHQLGALSKVGGLERWRIELHVPRFQARQQSPDAPHSPLAAGYGGLVFGREGIRTPEATRALSRALPLALRCVRPLQSATLPPVHLRTPVANPDSVLEMQNPNKIRTSAALLEKAKPGPEPERLKIDGDWKDAVGRALRREKPKGGWPDEKPRKKKAPRK
jgi:hypothetical protein